MAMNISLPPELEKYIQEKVASGVYLSADEAICEALWALQERDLIEECRLERLRQYEDLGQNQTDEDDLRDGKEVVDESRSPAQANINKNQKQIQHLTGHEPLSSYVKMGKTRREQIELNKPALELMQKWRLEDEKKTDEQRKEDEKAWELFKEIVDKHRDVRKLFTPE